MKNLNVSYEQTYVGHLMTPITASSVSIKFLQNLPVYRFSGTSLLRGLEVGLTHGFFLIGPFLKLNPLRNSTSALLIGFLSTIGLSLILNLAVSIYGYAMFYQSPEVKTEKSSSLQTLVLWRQFGHGLFIGLWAGCMFAVLLLNNIIK